MRIEIAGSISGDETAAETEVLEALENRVKINIDPGFKGRPSTRLYASKSHVLKLKSAFSMSLQNASLWCQKQLERERSWSIYHPGRTWVVLEESIGCAVANITPRRETLLQALSDDLHRSEQERFALLLDLLPLYFGFLRDNGARQDEGLTNYVVDNDRLYYIDDDIYSYDNLIAFSHSVAGFIRQFDFIGSERGKRLGEKVREEISVLDSNLVIVFQKQFSDAFMPPEKEPVRSALLRTLSPSPFYKKKRKSEVVAVLADIHSNAPALDAVLNDLHEEGIKEGLVLGDIVGYGPDPVWCVERVMDTGFPVIRGNHDDAAVRGKEGPGFSRAASWSWAWTKDMLSEAHRAWLGDLPLYFLDGKVYAVHGAPIDPTFFNAYVYEMTYEKNLEYMKEKELELCFHGHSHIAGCWQLAKTGLAKLVNEGEVVVESGAQHLVCPGSVGQPRDHAKGARYMIYDGVNKKLHFRQAVYDKAPVLQRMRELDFPNYLIRMFS